MFCGVRGEKGGKRKGENVRSRVHLSLYVARESREGTSLRRFLSRSGNFVLPLPAKKGSRANAAVVFSLATPRDVFPASTSPSFPSPNPPQSPFFSLFQPPFYFSVLLRREFARPYLRHVPPVQLRPPPPTIRAPFSLLLFLFLFPATSAGILVPLPLAVAGLLSCSSQPRKSKLDAKTRPNVHNARRPTYRVSGTIAGGHRFPPSGRDKCEDGEYRRFVPWLP